MIYLKRGFAFPEESDTTKFKTKLTDSGIIYAVNNHLLNPSLLERFLVLKVSWDLLCGSGGGESPRKADKNNLLSGTVIS